MTNKSKRKSSDKKMMDNLEKRFSEMYGESFGNEKITRMNIADADLEYSQLFGANKNLYRTIPSLVSGLKPGATRLLYAWWELEGRPSNVNPETLKKLKFRKAATISSKTMEYHPHGDAAMSELIGRLGQPWLNNVMLIEPQGSYGNCRGDEPGSGRYIECKLSEYTIDCFFDDFDNYCIPMKLSYTGDSYEPENLISKYPHILFNPQLSGIGWGTSSNIPSFNVAEVLDATISLIKDRNAKILLIPDIPTGCDIIDEGNFKEINKTGNSKLTMRASSNIDYANSIITFTSLPLNSSSSAVISKIISLRNTGSFQEISEIKDYTQNGDVKIELHLKKDAKPEKVLRQLYKKNVGLKSTVPVSITVIDDYKEYEYGVKDLLLAWLGYREDTVRSMLLNKMQTLINKQHMNDVLLMVFSQDNIEETIKIARTSNSRQETINRYMKKFKITSIQAGVIADMHVYNFNKDSYNRYKEAKESLKKEINDVNELLTHDDKLGEFIIAQLEEGKKKYGGPRRSKVVKEDDKNNEDIPDTEHLLAISETGYIKKISLKGNSSIGQVGKTNSPITILQVNNRENVLIADSSGMISKISVSAIPDMEFNDNGFEIGKLFSINGTVKAVMELPSMDILKVDNENLGIIFITKQGLAKKIKISELDKITDKKQCIVLNDGDEVSVAMFALNVTSKDIVIYTNRGDGVRLPLNEIRLGGLSAKGTSMISLRKDEEVVGASLMNTNKKLLFFITSFGKGKITETKYFPAMNRKDRPVNLIALEQDETLIGLSTVNKGDIIEVYTKKHDPETIEISSLVPSTRVSAGTKLIKTGRGDMVTGYKVFTK